jgi:SAM-dependent methyltransferase
MHETALKYGKQFFDKYVRDGQAVVEIGSQEIAGQPGLRTVAPAGCEYVGLDMEAGKGVDIVLADPYRLPIPPLSADAVVSSSVFEHCEFFWLMFAEMARITKHGGYIYLNSPSNGYVHRHPVDCWRFYPDAGQALAHWANYETGYEIEVVESFIGEPDPDIAHWEDFVCIWRKP